MHIIPTMFAHVVSMCISFIYFYLQICNFVVSLLYLTSQNMVATLGSGESGGSIHIMDLSDTIDVAMGSMNAYGGNIIPVASFNCTIWTADCNSDGTQAVIGEF